MQPIAIFLGLAASAAAIDVHLHMGNNCNGLTYVYANRNPSDCTQTGDTWTSASFNFIPLNWNIRGQVHSLKGCDSGSVISSGLSGKNAERMCFLGDSGNKRIRGAKYGFENKKREDEAGEGTGECKGPDFLVLEDGTRFNITGVEEAALTEMLNLAKTGTISEGLEKLREIPVSIKI